MFTGIIEATGKVEKIDRNESNIDFTLSGPFTQELKIDQSLAHNGCCLTVVEITENNYKVTAINETLEKTNLNFWNVGTEVNLERCLRFEGRCALNSWYSSLLLKISMAVKIASEKDVSSAIFFPAIS